MKSQELQKLIFSKCPNGEGPAKIFQDVHDAAGLRTIKRWCKMIAGTGSIQLSTPPGRPRTAHSWGNIQKVKSWLQRKRHLSVQKLASELDISYGSIRRILKDDLLLRPYKKTIEPLLTDAHKDKRKNFFNWVRSNFRKEDTMRILFSDEKMFDIDGMYNSQNDIVWAANRAEFDADESGGKKQRRKFPTKVMVWLGACSKGVTPLVIFEKGTVDHARYIKEVLPMALRYGNKVYGNNWTYQQDGARPHTHQLSQEWFQDNFPSFLDKGRWPPNSPDLNPLDYCIWDELSFRSRFVTEPRPGVALNDLIDDHWDLEMDDTNVRAAAVEEASR
uniref:Transposase n=1 Tax=Plectus sambesii TaxID=2011161 RepID=A0A914X0E5_9BILA